MPEDLDFKPIDEDAIIREVHNIDQIEAKTELNITQIESVNRLQTLGYIFNNKIIELETNGFMVKLKSLGRASMKEFVESLRSKREDRTIKEGGFMSKLMG